MRVINCFCAQPQLWQGKFDSTVKYCASAEASLQHSTAVVEPALAARHYGAVNLKVLNCSQGNGGGGD